MKLYVLFLLYVALAAHYLLQIPSPTPPSLAPILFHTSWRVPKNREKSQVRHQLIGKKNTWFCQRSYSSWSTKCLFLIPLSPSNTSQSLQIETTSPTLGKCRGSFCLGQVLLIQNTCRRMHSSSKLLRSVSDLIHKALFCFMKVVSSSPQPTFRSTPQQKALKDRDTKIRRRSNFKMSIQTSLRAKRKH